MDFGVVDRIVSVSDEQAFNTARELVKEDVIFSGSSSGAAIYGALKIAKELNPKDVMVVLLPDSGKNYLSTLYNDTWMKENIWKQETYNNEVTFKTDIS
ncbi:MAG: pyridoxal-phosphate dependent enzyme [Bacteroidota bacterium]